MAIGERLREARMRQRVDVSEVERITKIRAKYLRALENEEFDLLPGPTFVKSFLRTYSEYLGLDARLLIEEYRDKHEPGVEEEEPAPFTPRPPRRAPRDFGRPGLGWLVAGGLVGLLALFLVIGLVAGDEDGGSPPEREGEGASSQQGEEREGRSRRRGRGAERARRSVTLRIVPSGPTYVCLDRGPGTDTLFEGSISAPRSWRGRRLRLNLGRPSAVVRANGRRVETGGGANPVGFAFAPNRAPQRLPIGERPCA